MCKHGSLGLVEAAASPMELGTQQPVILELVWVQQRDLLRLGGDELRVVLAVPRADGAIGGGPGGAEEVIVWSSRGVSDGARDCGGPGTEYSLPELLPRH